MSKTTINPEGKTVFISGSNRGIGKALALEFLSNGAAKVYAGARNPASLTELAQQFEGRLIPVQLDVTDEQSIAAAAQQIDKVDILVNNAGIFAMGGIINGDVLGSLKTNLDVNVWGVVKLTNALKDKLIQPNGAIINISSVAGLGNMPMAGTYSVSKAAVHSVTQGLRGELANEAFLVMGVYPGPIDTDMAKDIQMDKDSPENVAKNVIIGLKEGVEDIFPDAMSSEINKLYSSNPKGLEQQFSAFVG